MTKSDTNNRLHDAARRFVARHSGSVARATSLSRPACVFVPEGTRRRVCWCEAVGQISRERLFVVGSLVRESLAWLASSWLKYAVASARSNATYKTSSW